jgi:hypothetical protein
VLNRKSHQAEFVEKHGHHFTRDELNTMRVAWASYFPGLQDQGRNGLLWFCLAPDQVLGAGAKPLFTYFGGEAIYMPLVEISNIGEKLRSLGAPVVVETSLDPQELRTFSEFPLATNSLSLYHRTINPDACIHAREGYLKRDVSRDEIVRVTRRESFFYAHGAPA